MSVHVSSRAWLVQGLTFAEKLVLVKLADMASDEGVCWPSTATLGAQCGLDRRSVRRIIARLEAAGHVARKARFNDKGLSTSNWLTVLPPDDRRPAIASNSGEDRPVLPPARKASKGDGGVPPGGTGESSLGGTGRSSKPSIEPSKNLQARDAGEGARPRRSPPGGGGGAASAASRDLGEVVSALTAFERSRLSRGASVMIGGQMVTPGTAQFAALASALAASGAGL